MRTNIGEGDTEARRGGIECGGDTVGEGEAGCAEEGVVAEEEVGEGCHDEECCCLVA